MAVDQRRWEVDFAMQRERNRSPESSVDLEKIRPLISRVASELDHSDTGVVDGVEQLLAKPHKFLVSAAFAKRRSAAGVRDLVQPAVRKA